MLADDQQKQSQWRLVNRQPMALESSLAMPVKSKTDGPCYLCRDPLAGTATSLDHVPPKQFFPKRYLKNLKQDLLTTEVHRDCNTRFGVDEEYFLHEIGPTAHGTRGGNELFDDNVLKAIQQPAYGPRITQRMLAAFTPQVNGVWLPPSNVAKQFDGKRVYRVLWKIIRGCFSTRSSECGLKITSFSVPTSGRHLLGLLAGAKKS